MKSDDNEVQCPFCGGHLDDLTGQQIELLRAAVLSDILPALLHDARHSLDSAYFFYNSMEHTPKENQHDKRFAEILKHGEHSLRELGQFFHTLRDIYHAPSHDFLIEVRELPKQIVWIWDVFGIRPLPDMTGLHESRGKIRLAPYRDALIFAVHAALISIRRDRNPDFGLALNIIKDELCTTLKLGHHDGLETDSLQWQAFRSAVKHAGGTTQTTSSGGSTSVEWCVPLASGDGA